MILEPIQYVVGEHHSREPRKPRSPDGFAQDELRRRREERETHTGPYLAVVPAGLDLQPPRDDK